MANMSKKRRTVVGRSDVNFVKEMKELAKFRFMKNLEIKLPTVQDMQKLAMRTESWKGVKFELQSKPRRENI